MLLYSCHFLNLSCRLNEMSLCSKKPKRSRFWFSSNFTRSPGLTPTHHGIWFCAIWNKTEMLEWCNKVLFYTLESGKLCRYIQTSTGAIMDLFRIVFTRTNRIKWQYGPTQMSLFHPTAINKSSCLTCNIIMRFLRGWRKGKFGRSRSPVLEN